MHKFGKIDENQKQIVRALRAVGARVESLADVGNGCPDLLVLFRKNIYLLEIKRDAKAKLKPAQVIFHEEWQCPFVHIVTSVDAALIAIGAVCSETNG